MWREVGVRAANGPDISGGTKMFGKQTHSTVKVLNRHFKSYVLRYVSVTSTKTYNLPYARIM